ncbi:MAG: sugar transferase [Acidobacteriota bacterium]
MTPARLLGRCVALVALFLLAPLLVVLALGVRLTSPGPALFRQERVGRGGRAFEMLKFRTMTSTRTRGEPQITASGDARVTAFGRLLRASKLDELPELYNIVRGDMGFVGPRPEVPRYVDVEDPLWQRVLESAPGLTDPTTLRLRNEEGLVAQLAALRAGDVEAAYRDDLLPYKLRSSAAYLERQTPWTDLVVLIRTLVAIVSSPAPPTVDEVLRARDGWRPPGAAAPR